MKPSIKRFFIIYLVAITFFSAYSALAVGTLSPGSQGPLQPGLWVPNSSANTITPNPSSLQVPCANIVGGCSGGGSTSGTISNASTSQVAIYNGTSSVYGTSTFTSNGQTLSITNNTSANTVSITAATNTGSGASTNGNLFVNCSSDTQGLCENIYQGNSSLSTAQHMFFVNSGSPDNTVASGSQTLSSTTTELFVSSVAGFPTSGYLLIQDATSTSENANGAILQYTSVSSSPAGFIAAAGTLYPNLTSYTFRDQSKVTYVDNNDHQVKVEIFQHSENGAGTPLKITGTGAPCVEFTQLGTTNASGTGQFEFCTPNNYGTTPLAADMMGFLGRNDANTAFDYSGGFTRPGITDEAKWCFGDCRNLLSPWNSPWEGDVNIYPNSGEGDTNIGSLPMLVLREPDLPLTAPAIAVEASSGVRIYTVDASGNVSTTGNFYHQGVQLPNSVIVVTSTPTTVPAADTTSTLATSTNSVGTTTAYTLNIPANKLGTAGAMYDIKQSGEFVQNSGNTIAPYILYLALNGTIIASDTPQTLAGASSPTGTWYAEYTLGNFGGSTGVQIATINTFAQRGGSQLLPRTDTAISSVDSTQPITLSVWISNASTTATETVTSGQVATQFIGPAPAVVTSVTTN